ncbi:MAG: DUF4169 family protein [Magnetospirillum sp.]|nr:MAG: DUF4169 family protein [Magnetospirillum sp.]
MAEIVNLNRYRKAKDRVVAAEEAKNNRVLFGRKRTEKEADRRVVEKEKGNLDGKKLDD